MYVLDAVQVAFVPDTHYAFTVGKDGLVKYWDADRWELLLTLEGHKAEVRMPQNLPRCNSCMPRNAVLKLMMCTQHSASQACICGTKNGQS
jgi:WD40 repeat protein